MCSEGMCSMKDIMLNYRKVRRIKQWNCPTISIPRIIIFLFMFDVLFVSAKYASWTNEDADFGTVHEQLGQPHFPYAEFTPYRSKAKYNTEPKYNSFGIRPTHLFTHTLFGKASSVPKDYITFVNGTNALAFGQKSAENSWASLLCCNKLMLVWTIFMLFLIIAIPFVAVTYFCFCFYRCPTVCECNEYVDRRMRHLWSILLLLLILGLIVGLIVVMLNDKLIDQGVQQNWANIQKNHEDICTFIKDTSDHVYHVFVNNFEELETHLNAQLMDVSNHIFMDLSDASGLYALTELEEILLNMPRALTLMERVDKDIDTLTFYIAQYRDGLRFIRRKLTYFLTVWCDYKRCNDILRTSGILKWDTSVCLHLDLLPNIPIFIESLHDIIRANLLYIPKQGLYNYQVVGEMIRENLHDQLPQFSIKLAELSEIYSKQGAALQDLIRSRMSTTYNQHANMTKVFHELEQSYGRDRKVISIALSVSILTITILLISALICGWCVRRNNSGTKCLLVAILLISVILSLLLLVCLFYSIMGLIIYHAVCIPRTAEERYNVFNTDIEQIFNVNESICRKDQNIFDLLRDAGLYDINILRNENTNNITPEYVSEFTGDLSSIVIITEQHKIMLNDMRNGNLSDYHGQWIRKQLCHKLSQVDLMQCKLNLQEFGKSLHGDRRSLAYQYRINGTLNNMCRLSFDMNQIVSLQRPIDDLINRIRADVTTIDRLITRNDSDFNNTILPLIEAITKAETFLHTRGAEYINALTLKFVEYLEDSINKYVEHVIQECTFTIGRCGPLAQMHNRSINNLCHNLADPINGYWLGLLICGLLFFPILLVAHKLLCLYRLYAAIIYLNDNQFDCPACSGTPFVQAPYIISTGNKIHFCGCEEPYKEKDA